MDGPRHHFAKLSEVQRLEQVLEGAELHGFDCRLGGPVRGDDDHGQAGIDFPDLAVGFETLHVGQADVEDHGVGRLAADHADPLAGGSGRVNLEAGGGQDLLQRVADVRLVVDDQETLHDVLDLGAMKGSLLANGQSFI